MKSDGKKSLSSYPGFLETSKLRNIGMESIFPLPSYLMGWSHPSQYLATHLMGLESSFPLLSLPSGVGTFLPTKNLPGPATTTLFLGRMDACGVYLKKVSKREELSPLLTVR
jgi:hypothetical protein